jgi:hypothetical protein
MNLCITWGVDYDLSSLAGYPYGYGGIGALTDANIGYSLGVSLDETHGAGFDGSAFGIPETAGSLTRSGVIFAVATGLSRLIGLVREIVQAALFGISGPVNAFEIAFLIPNTVRSLVADSALSAAFVPVFSDLLVKGERKRAWRVASSLFWLMLLGLGGLTALFVVVAPWVMAIFGR